jgi:AraC-like DNA-binding protein
MPIHQWAATLAEASSAQQSRSCRDLVEQAEQLALADLDGPLHISALCSALKVSERTLRKAFHEARGLSPCRQLRMLRLSEARRTLLTADRKLVTVTEIATGCGFLELGRFSVEYRKVFGESPSQTLRRRTRRDSSGQPCRPGQFFFQSLRTRISTDRVATAAC